ncbi:hypothetical protein quinque_001121 [Culex quinquefasciatus]
MPTKIAKKSDKSRKEKNRLAGVRKAPAGQQSAAAAAAVPGRYQCEASPVPAPIQYPAGNFVQERQIDVDSETDSVLCLCRWLRRTGHEKVVETLLQHGAKMEAQSERTKDTPLSLVCSGGRYEVVELLLNMNANRENRNVPDYTPLSLAASEGYVKII